MTEILLIVGYILAVPPLFVLIPALRNPRTRWPILAAELIGAALISAGWFARDNLAGGAINAVWAIIFSGLWLRAAFKHKAS